MAGFLGLLGAVFTVGFSCAVPLAAFAAIGELSLGGAAAYALISAIWLANQLIGFIFLHYPLEPPAFAWGAALYASGLLGTAAAQGARSIFGGTSTLAAPATFFAAFAAYEGTLFIISVAAASGTANFTAAIAGRVFFINGAAFAALFLLRHAGRITGLVQSAKYRAPLRR
ncbi:MAG: hypothetical protein J2P49_07105 [Methylocapsa sp.]|nr:hypothetical protein [Methylocapsa sp.]